MEQEPTPSTNGGCLLGPSNHSRVSVADVHHYIKGIGYPCDKDDMIELAIENNAPDEVIYVMEFLPNREFDSPMEVAHCVGMARADLQNTHVLLAGALCA
jgi:hypothetical protein